MELEDPEGAVLVEAGGVAGVPHSEHSGLGAGGLDRATGWAIILATSKFRGNHFLPGFEFETA